MALWVAVGVLIVANCVQLWVIFELQERLNER